MKRLLFLNFLFISLAGWSAAATDVWSGHITAVGDWKTTASVFNASSESATFTLTKVDDSGNTIGSPRDFNVPARSWKLVANTVLDYSGSAHFVSTADLLVKISYQFGDSHSLCEFYLGEDQGKSWTVPNSVHSWFDYTGLAVLNPGASPVDLTLEAWDLGATVGTTTVSVPAKQRYINLSDGIWAGLGYRQFDTIIIRSSADIPAPLSITGNNANDRHLFFTAKPVMLIQGGDLVATDSIVGNLRYVPAGTFTQGSPDSELCRYDDETQFTHTLTRKIAVMETEVTRQMWANLKAAQPTLIADPSSSYYSPGMSHPVQQVSWYEALLFANLLSLQQGLTRCYYTDPSKTTFIDLANYNNETTAYCDFSANGYRLPTEGEWEYFCRAGTTGPFWVAEPHLVGNCMMDEPSGVLAGLESAAWLHTNSKIGGYPTPHPVGQKAANPWNLYDVSGNEPEWCWDWYSPYPTGAQTDYTEPWQPPDRVVRGGSAFSLPWELRSAARIHMTPTQKQVGNGFRLVRTLP